MRLVAYLRVSSKSQVDGYGLESQRKAIRAWARANKHKIVAECVDEGVSGTTDAVDRPGLTEALAMLKHPPIAEGLLVARLDRLARAIEVQEAALGIAWRAGAEVFTADTGQVLRDDPDDYMRTVIRKMIGLFAEMDRAAVSKRLRDGRRAKAATGRKVTGSYAFGSQAVGRGHERDAGPNPEEQAAVARIVALRAAGDSYRAIAEQLDAEGLKPRRAERWSGMSVRAVALREVNI